MSFMRKIRRQMLKNTGWTPTAKHIAWVKDCVIDRINDGGFWATTYGVYQFNLKDKIVSLVDRTVSCPVPEPKEARSRDQKVFEALGWAYKG